MRLSGIRITTSIQDSNEKAQESAGEIKDSALKRELSAQEKIILEIIIENGNITSAQLMERLNVKKRRAQVILGKMVEDKLIYKKGASRSTNYVFNEELLKS